MTEAPSERPIQLVCKIRTRSGQSIPVIVQQFVGISGDAEEPLFQVFLDDRRAAAFAVAVFAPDLFARQGGVAVRAEIHRRHLAVGQAMLVQLDEEPLGPFIVFGIRRNRFAPPVEHGAHRSASGAHLLDILIGPLLRMDAALDGGIFSRQTEGVEAHGEEDVVAVHAHEAGACICRRHGIPVTDVQVAGRIRQHGQGVVLGFVGINIGMVQAIGFPFCLPFRFNLGLGYSRSFFYSLKQNQK